MNIHRWLNAPIEKIVFVALDIETTGLSPVEDRIVEIGGVKFTTKEVRGNFHSLVNPGIPIPHHVSRIHGITDEDVKGKPNIRKVLVSLKDFLSWDTLIIFYNAWFDLSFLGKAFYDYGISPPSLPVIDLYQIIKTYRHLLPVEKGLSLKKVVEGMGRKRNFHFHRAVEDSLAVKEIFLRVLEKTGVKKLKELIQEKNVIQLKDGFLSGIKLQEELSFLNPWVENRERIGIEYKLEEGSKFMEIIPLDIVKAGKKFYIYASLLPSFKKKFFELRKISYFIKGEKKYPGLFSG